MYGTGKRRYLSFGFRVNLHPLPPSTATLCRFVAYLASEGLKAQLICRYLAAVSIETGFTPLPRGVSSTDLRYYGHQPISGGCAKAQATPHHSAGTVLVEGCLGTGDSRLFCWAMSLTYVPLLKDT